MKEKDDFWNIESLLPPRQRSRACSSAPTVAPAIISHGSEDKKSERAENTLGLHLPKKEKTFFREYKPVGNPLLHSVHVYTEENTYKLHQLFHADAVHLLEKEGHECPYVPCYSYIPQYSQLNAAQKAYYLYFREEANKGNYIKTNQSYFLLYMYEIINLPDFIPPKIGVERMAKAWRAYRNQLSGVDKYMTAWLADYALVHNVPCPNVILQSFLSEILKLSNLKEFYLGGGSSSLSECQTDAFFTLSSDYQYKSGRYASGEYSALFLEHVGRVSGMILSEILDNESRANSFQTVCKEYPAYIGALCAEKNRYFIEVSYSSVSGTEALRSLLTAVVKYAENKVRAALSIKSRLSVSGLPHFYKEKIDAYFNEHLPVIKRHNKKEESLPAYEKLYEAASCGFSSRKAQEIEESSWQNTRMLISEEEENEVFLSDKTEQNEKSTLAQTSKLPDDDVRLLCVFVQEGEAAARVFAKKKGMTFELSVSRVNEYFMDTMGDVVIELEEDSAHFIEDYESEVLAFLAPYTNDGKQ